MPDKKYHPDFIPDPEPSKKSYKTIKSSGNYHPDFTPDPDEEGGQAEPSVWQSLTSGVSSWINEHPKVREIGERFLTGTSPEFKKTLQEHDIPRLLGTPEAEQSVLPPISHEPDTFAGGFAKSLYEDFVRPQFTPSGFAGWGSPGPRIPGKTGRFGTVEIQDLGNVRPEQKLLTAGPKFQAETPGGVTANTAVGESIPIRRSTEIPYRPTIQTPSGRIEQSFSTAAGDTPRAQEAWNKFAESANAAPREPAGLLPEGVRQPHIDDLMLSEEGKLPGEMSTADALMYEPEFKPWRGLSNLSEAILGRDIMKRDIEAGLDPHRGPIDWGPIAEGETSETPLISSRPKGEVQKPTAKFKGWQQTGYEDMPDFPLYDVEGGESHGTTTDAAGLKKLGIEPPSEIPPNPHAVERPLPMQVAGSKNIAVGGADPRVLDVLGKSLYSGDRPTITVRELLQNAFDEHRIAGQTKDIKVLFSHVHPNPATGEESTSVAVKDLGRGLTPEQLYTVFTDVGKTGKGNELLASGGFGFAKAAPLLSGKYAQVESIVQEGLQRNKYTFEGTPEQLKNQKVGVPLKKEKVSLNTPTGMKVTTFFEKNKNLHNAHNFAGLMTEASPSVTSKVHVGQSYLPDEEYRTNFLEGIKKPNTFDISQDYAKLHERKPSLPKVDTIETPHFKIDLHYEDPTGIENSRYQLNFQNKGLYSGSLSKNYASGTKILNAPERIDANIISKVEEGEEGYPFTASREALSDEVSSEVNKWIHDNIVKGSLEKERQKLQHAYDSMEAVNVGSTTNRKTVLFDPGKRLTSEEIEQFKNNPKMQEFIKQIDSTINDILESLGNDKAKEQLEGVGIILHDRVHGLHVPNPATGKSTILINPFEYLAPASVGETSIADAALENQYTILHEVGHVGTENPAVIPRVNINELNDPRIGSFMNAYLESLNHQGASPGHEVDFLKRLAVIYAKYGPAKTFKSADEIARIFEESPGSKNLDGNVQELLQLYYDSRGREATTEDILSRTGLRSEVGKSNGKGNNASNAKPDGGGTPTEKAVNKLFSAMADAKIAAEEQATNLRVERGRRFAASAGVKTEGMEGAKKSLGKMRGEYEKSELPDSLKMKKEDVDSLFTAVKRANITEPEKIRGYTALFKLLNGEAPPVRSELKILNDVFGNGFGDKIVEMHGGIGLVGLRLAKVANTMKALQSSADLSAPLRQGIGLVHRPEWRDAFVEMFKYAAKPEYFKAAMEALEERPTYLLGREAGLFLAKPDSLLDGEEAFMNNYLKEVGQIPGGVGTAALLIPKGSERAYTGFLNKLRADVFDNLIREASTAGHEAFTIAEHVDEETGQTRRIIVPSKTTENIAKYVNIATGRGNLGRLEKITPELNMLIWSPKLIKSRLDTLNPMYYASLDPFTRRQAIKSLFAIAAFGAITTSIAAISGIKVMGNPFSTPMNWFKPATKKGEFMFGQKSQTLSADFGKMRFPKNQVLDPWAGYQQPIVAAFRFTSGSTDAGPQQRGMTALNFGANKTSPAASLGIDIAFAKKWTGGGNYINRFGQPANLPREVVKRFVPIFTQDLYDLAKSDNTFAEKVGLGTLSGLGMGVQDYPERSANKPRKMSLSF